MHHNEANGARRIRFDDGDRFCLDGEPLVLVENGREYGEDGSQYRTERESVRRILAFGSSSAGPEGFVVHEADGHIASYEAVAAPHRVRYEQVRGPETPITEGARTIQWSVTGVVDRAGNGMLFEYDTFTVVGAHEGRVHLPKAITYTAWNAEEGRRRVEIFYEARPDRRELYVAGTRSRLDYRIDRIEMHAPSAGGATARAWYYELGYLDEEEGEPTSITGRSLLRSVTRCNAAGVCLPPTTFEWSLGSMTDYMRVELELPAGLLSTQLGDVTGDGRDDLIIRDQVPVLGLGASIYESDGTGFVFRARSAPSVAGAPLLIDVTGDGRSELIAPEHPGTCVSSSDCAESQHCVRVTTEGMLGVCSPNCLCTRLEAPPPGGSCPWQENTCEVAGANCVGVGGHGECDESFGDEPEGCSCYATYTPREVGASWCPSTSTCAASEFCGPFDADTSLECMGGERLVGNGWRIHRYGGGMVTAGQLIEGPAALVGHAAINIGDLDGDGAPDLLRRDGRALWSLGVSTRTAATPFDAPSIPDPDVPAESVWFDPRAPMPGTSIFDPSDAAFDPAAPHAPTQEHRYGAVVEIVDLDADGRTDVLIPIAAASPGDVNRYVRVTPGVPPTTHELETTNLRAKARDQILIDVNGDGLVDAVDLREDCTDVGETPSMYVCAEAPGDPTPRFLGLRLNVGAGFAPRSVASGAGEYVPFWPEEVQPTTTACPTGPATTPSTDPTSFYPLYCTENGVPWYAADLRYRVLDHNQDGAQDFLILGPSPTIFVSDRMGAFRPLPLPFTFDDQLAEFHRENGHGRLRRPVFLVGDVNGDGQPDFVHGETQLMLELSTGGRADLLLRVVDGVGGEDALEYASLSDPGVYDDQFDFGSVSHPDGPEVCGYPNACVNRRAHVVWKLRRNNPGYMQDRTITYRYAGGRRDARTGEFLGFARIYSEESGTGETTEIWTRPTVEHVSGTMRGAYHPLAHRPSRVYSAVRVGEEVHVTRIDYRFGFEGIASRPFGHPLRTSLGFELERGLRVLLSDVVVRQYRDEWSAWSASSGAVSERYRDMRARFVDAWRSDVRQLDYQPYECDERRCAPSRPGAFFPYPSAWTDTTYDVDIGPDSGDLFPEIGGEAGVWFRLLDYDRDVQLLSRTVLAREENETAWLIGLPSAVEVERCRVPLGMDYGRRRCVPDATEPDVVRSRVHYGYDGNLVRTITREPFAPAFDAAGDPTGLSLTVTLLRDRGNITEILQTTPYGETRRRTVEYDDLEHIFPGAVTAYVNGLTLTSRTAWHAALGVPLVTQAPSGARTHLRYDGLGRPRGVLRPGGDWESIDYSAPGPRMGMTVQTSGAAVPDSIVTLDQRLRPTAISVEGYRTTTPVEMEIGYDALGRATSRSLPHYLGEPAATFESSFDNLARPTALSFRPSDGATPTVLATYDYWLEPSPTSPGTMLMASSMTDAVGNESQTWLDLRGWLERTRDGYVPDGGTPRWIETRTQHDLRGVARTTALASDTLGTSPAQETTEVDRLGRPLVIVDPDRGETRVRYSSFGEVVWQRNALGQETTFLYDELGRLHERVDDGATTTWVWDTAPNGGGLLAASLSPDGHSISYTYDAHGRLSREEHDTGDIDYAYDPSTGLLQEVIYPRNATGHRVRIRYVHEEGRIAEIWDDTTSSPGRLLWEATQRHADGRIAVERTGGGARTERVYDDRTGRPDEATVDSGGAERLMEVDHDFDAAGRMERRVDRALGRSERFEHDSLGRLTAWVREAPGGPETIEYAYDDRGNLTTITNIDTGEVDTLAYDEVRNAGPHGVTSFNGQELEYDLAGRQIRGIDGREVDYNHLDLPTEVRAGARRMHVRYDAEGRRVQATHVAPPGPPVLGPPRVDPPSFDRPPLPRPPGGVTPPVPPRPRGGGLRPGVLRIDYVGRLYERRASDSSVQHVCYVYGPEGPVAQIVMDDGGTTRRAFFLHHDGLGSVSFATDDSGELVPDSRRWFSPFGRRLAEDGSYAAPPTTQPEITRGFTGHEHDAPLDLVNMQGRIYDPRLRRFTTPDPLVFPATSTQAWNPYSYVLNSPVDATDPTGLLPVWTEPRPLPPEPPHELGPAVEMQLNETSNIENRAAGSTLPGGGTGGGGGLRPSPNSWLTDAVGLGRAFVEGVIEGTEGLIEGLGTQILENPASPVTPFYRAASAYQNFEQGNIGEGILDVVSIHPIIGAGRIAVETTLGVAETVDTVSTTIGSGSAEDVAHLGGVLTPAVVAAVVSRRVAAPGAVSRGTTVQRVARGGAQPVRTGQVAEAAVRSVEDIGPKVSIEVGGRTRIPDGLTATVLTEVKNARSLSYTRQLRDFAAYAQERGLRFDLWVRPSTRLSAPLARAVANNTIKLRIIPIQQ